MTEYQDSLFNELKLKIKLLERQGDQKAGKMEEKLLLWLVSETIEQSGDGEELLENTLERICQIRDVPLCFCYQTGDKRLKKLISSYARHPNDPGNISLQLHPSLFDKIKSGVAYISHKQIQSQWIEASENLSFEPGSITIFPFHSLYIPSGIFVFVSDAKTGDRITNLSIAVRQLLNTVIEKFDKLTLMEELKELNMSFEGKLRERSEKLSQQNENLKEELKELKKKENQLRKRIDISEKTNDLKSSFLMNIGHEIRTPLNGILGFAEIIRKNDLGEEEKNKYINIIKSCGKSLLKIVDDVIDLSKIESEQIEVEKETFPITKFMTGLYDHFKNDELFKQREQIDLRLNININGNTTIETDRNKLWQILVNLIGNALKFTESGYVEFGCRLANENAKKGKADIVFFVKDTGVGIPKTMHEAVFSRFVKIEHDISKLYGGTGLGLTIAKTLTEMLDGRIWFDSQSGAGTEFYVCFPSVVLLINGNEKPLTSKEMKLKYNWQGKRVLIVEDDEMSYIYLKEVLKSTNIEILRAHNGREAVEITEHQPAIDMVLMDIKLPEMDGYEATKRIKNIRKDMPVIAQTAYAMLDDQEKILQVGCDDYISKPINRRKLLTTMDAYLS